MSPLFRAICGKNFGDEGKGLLTDYLAGKEARTLVVRHNGGAQSGHTVLYKGHRFVFHELSSGSFRGAATYWAKTFYPDLYKLAEELTAFANLSAFRPTIYADPLANITIIDDVFLNMAIETKRGAARHGSCGMGINECDLRVKAGYSLKVGDLFSLSKEEISHKLRLIRREYLPKRLAALGLSLAESGPYGELLASNQVLENYAAAIMENSRLITLAPPMPELFKDFAAVIFEHGQGLLLGGDRQEFWPHVTASKTGLFNPRRLLGEIGAELDEVIYVSRSYLTRHGAGILPHECPASALGLNFADETNVPNSWQGSLRYARHGDSAEFVRAVKEDLAAGQVPAALALTHLDKTGGKVLTVRGAIPWQDFINYPEIKAVFKKVYLSFAPDSVEQEVLL